MNETGKNSAYNSVTIDNVTTYRDMLHFSTIEDYLIATERLAQFQDLDIEIFNEIYVPYTYEEIVAMSEEDEDAFSDELEAIENEIGFSESGIYAQFENKLNFKSLRSVIAVEEEKFLQSEYPDWGNDPDNHFIVLTEERTLLNPYAEVKIGNSLYVFGDGLCVEITDGDYATLVALRGNIDSYTSYKNTQTAGDDYYEQYGDAGKVNASCKYGKSKSGYEDQGSSTRRIKHKIAISTFITRKGVAETTNYKFKKKWKKYKTACGAAVHGGGCGYTYFGGSDLLNDESTNSAKSVSAKYYLNKRAENNGLLYGHYSGAGGI